MNLLAHLLLASWQATAVVSLTGPEPGVCAIRYEDPAAGLTVVIEKRQRGLAPDAGFVNAFAVSGAGVKSARLVTSTFDSAKQMKPAKPRSGEAVRAEAVLDETTGDGDDGALLIHSLSNLGGRVEIKRGKGLERFELPHPLPRMQVVSRYLFCTRDLILPRSPAPEG